MAGAGGPLFVILMMLFLAVITPIGEELLVGVIVPAVNNSTTVVGYAAMSLSG